MKYEEMVIEGETMYRTHQDGKWFTVSNGILTMRIKELESLIERIKNANKEK